MADSVGRSGPFLPCGLRLVRAGGASGVAHAGRKPLPVARMGPPFRLCRAAAGNRRPRHLRHDPPLQGFGARRRRGERRQAGDDRLLDDPGAGGLARRGRATLRSGALRRRRRRPRGLRRLQLPRRRQYSRGAIVGTCVRQRRRRRRLQARGRARNQHRARLEAGRQPGVGVPARDPRRRVPTLHHRARPGRRRVPLQPFPSRSGDARRD